MKIANRLALATVPVAAALTSLPAAAATDYSSITAAFSATDIVTGLLSIGAVLASIYVAWKGIKMVIGMMRGG